jgi:hypothetical protein
MATLVLKLVAMGVLVMDYCYLMPGAGDDDGACGGWCSFFCHCLFDPKIEKNDRDTP